MSAPRDSAGVVTMACIEEEDWCNTGRIPRWPIARPTGHPRGEDRAEDVAERPVVLLKSGNADGGKGPQFKVVRSVIINSPGCRRAEKRSGEYGTIIL